METLANDYNSASSNINFIHDDNHDTDNDDGQWMNINGDEYNNDNRPLYSGSSINVSDAIRRIIGFSLDANLDKQKVTNLLRLIKSHDRRYKIIQGNNLFFMCDFTINFFSRSCSM